jgi:hypothetical protein
MLYLEYLINGINQRSVQNTFLACMRLYTSSPALEGKKKGKKETKNKRKKEKDAWRHLHLRPQ